MKTGVMAAENSALHHRNKLILNVLKQKTVILNCNIISLFFCIYHQTSTASVSIRNFQKHKRNLTNLKLLNGGVYICIFIRY